MSYWKADTARELMVSARQHQSLSFRATGRERRADHQDVVLLLVKNAAQARRRYAREA